MQTQILSIDVGITNIGTCIMHYDATNELCPFIVDHWERINLTSYTGPLSVYEATQKMVCEFLKRPHFYSVDHVIIESQEISTEKMKRMSNAMQSHFETMSLVRDNANYDTLFSTGAVKTKVYTGPQTWPEIKIKDVHEKNKRIGIQHTLALLDQDKETNEKWIPWFKRQKKQDDVSDAFLQGAYFLNKTFIKQTKKRKNESRKSTGLRKKHDICADAQSKSSKSSPGRDTQSIEQRIQHRNAGSCITIDEDSDDSDDIF